MPNNSPTYPIYLAKVDFLESSAYKVRPIIVVGTPRGTHAIVLAIPISSQHKNEDIDVELNDTVSAGLHKNSVAQVHRLAAISGDRVIEAIGELSAADSQNVRIGLKELLEL